MTEPVTDNDSDSSHDPSAGPDAEPSPDPDIDPSLESLFREGFGFTWGETDETTWLRSDEGDYKRVHPAFFGQLRDLADGRTDPSTHDERVRRTVALLYEEGYLRPGEDVAHHETPEDIRLAPRFGLFAATVAVFAAAITVRWPEIRALPADLEFGTGLALVVLPVLLGSIAIHEASHYVPSRRYFDPTIRFGLLNGVIPAIITRTTDAWQCPRNVRIWISAAGPFADVVVATGFALAFVVVPGQPILGFLALVIAARAVFVLNPLLEGDGYWILVDAMGWHNLRSRGFRDLRDLTTSWPAAYALLVVVFTVVFVVLNVVILATVFGVV
ncbi:M50 family metallopeptidase [Natrarchaeobaculum aegyptiacum]|uniref:Peptidase M50 n=1 Tax=Natrarchaeobaculum aegyptiacum TaxID=745377 RepID=A0A2Z2HT03_9EURY|nr:M50 family metallopeptidase [Natrarchaeobaculum aegyptiacum]ARS90361.1 hypothetical protein B1756_11915 [Natrarchaeobaculum aegyptiacum]